jgi:hypothetical protein
MKAPSELLPGESEESLENFSQNSQDLSPGTAEYETKIFPP